MSDTVLRTGPYWWIKQLWSLFSMVFEVLEKKGERKANTCKIIHSVKSNRKRTG